MLGLRTAGGAWVRGSHGLNDVRTAAIFVVAVFSTLSLVSQSVQSRKAGSIAHGARPLIYCHVYSRHLRRGGVLYFVQERRCRVHGRQRTEHTG